MKLAILSDIHGNTAALREVLAAARRSDVEHLLVLGDLVGYYYDALGVLALLSEWPTTIIGGNHERMLGEARASIDSAARLRQKYGSALAVALETLSPDQIGWLTDLPARLTTSFGSHILELCHGSPDDQDRYVYPTADDDDLRRCEIPGRIVLMGHTHYPMIAVRPNCILVNAGSVGQARDLGGFASWILFDTKTGVIAPQRTAFDTSELINEVRARDPDLPYLADILRRNRL